MKVAEIMIHCGRYSLGEGAPIGSVGFDNLDAARNEFERLADLLKRHEERANDLDKTVVVRGICDFTCPLAGITSIALADFALINEQEAGVRDAFPNIFKR